MLESVLKAIAELKESQGSTVRNIINQIKSNPERQTGRRNYDITSQVRRALTQGRKAGIIVNNARKYKLTTTPSKCSNLLARSHAGKRRRKSSKRKRKGRSTKRRRRRRSDSASVSEASDHPSEASSTHAADGTVTEANRKRRSRSKKRSKRRSRKRRQTEESCDDGTDDDEDEGDTRRKRPRRSESEKGSSNFTWLYVLLAKQNFYYFR